MARAAPTAPSAGPAATPPPHPAATPSTGPASAPPRSGVPTLRAERRLLRDGATLVAGMDEVGRGSPAGPVHVGVVVVDAGTPPAPYGVRDSKLVVAAEREALVPRIRAWATGAVGSASAAEVDAVGLTCALRLAGLRALAQLDAPPDLVLLDGGHDWLTGSAVGGSVGDVPPVATRVVTRVRADRTCASVAAASILAKVARDAVMVGLAVEYPEYGWEANKGYGTPVHLEALARLGPTPHHRRSWRLPGCA